MTRKQYQEALLAAYLEQWLRVMAHWATRQPSDAGDEDDGALPPIAIINKNAKGEGGDASIRTNAHPELDGGEDEPSSDEADVPFVPSIVVDGPETEDTGSADDDLDESEDWDDEDWDDDAGDDEESTGEDDEDLDDDAGEPDDAGEEEDPNGDEEDREEPSGWEFLQNLFAPAESDATSTTATEWKQSEGRVSNANSAFTLNYLEMAELKDRQLSRAFAGIVELLADDPTAEDLDMGNEKVSRRRVVDRAANKGLSPRYPIVDKKRTSLSLVLDTSTSCEAQAELYRKLAAAAAAHGDVRIFDGPNGHVMREYNPKTGSFAMMPDREWINSGAIGRQPWPRFMDGSTVLFFGDADGWEVITEASWRMNVYWLTPWNATKGDEPRRPSDMSDNFWGGTEYQLDIKGVYNGDAFRKGLPSSPDQFKGSFHVATTAEDLIRVSKKIRVK